MLPWCSWKLPQLHVLFCFHFHFVLLVFVKMVWRKISIFHVSSIFWANSSDCSRRLCHLSSTVDDGTIIQNCSRKSAAKRQLLLKWGQMTQTLEGAEVSWRERGEICLCWKRNIKKINQAIHTSAGLQLSCFLLFFLWTPKLPTAAQECGSGHCLTQICQETLLHKFTGVKTIRQLVLENYECVPSEPLSLALYPPACRLSEGKEQISKTFSRRSRSFQSIL